MAYCTIADVLKRAPEFGNDVNSGVTSGETIPSEILQSAIDEQYVNVRACLQPRFDLATIDALADPPPALVNLNAIYAAQQLYQQQGPQSAERNDIRIRQLGEQRQRYEKQIANGLLIADDGSLVDSINGPTVSLAESTAPITAVYLYGTRGLRSCSPIAALGSCNCA